MRLPHLALNPPTNGLTAMLCRSQSPVEINEYDHPANQRRVECPVAVVFRQTLQTGGRDVAKGIQKGLREGNSENSGMNNRIIYNFS